MRSNPPLTPATRNLYNALAAVRTATITVTEPDGDTGMDPYEIEQWAVAELQAVSFWRYSCHLLAQAASEGPSAWAKRRTRIRGFVAVWLAERVPSLDQADDCDALVAGVVAAIDRLGAELGVAREALPA